MARRKKKEEEATEVEVEDFDEINEETEDLEEEETNEEESEEEESDEEDTNEDETEEEESDSEEETEDESDEETAEEEEEDEETEDDENTEVEEDKETEKLTFQQTCAIISVALRKPSFTKLNCRVKVLVQDRTAIIYQGLRSNVWARLRYDGSHTVYRHALLTALREDEDTAPIFKDV